MAETNHSISGLDDETGRVAKDVAEELFAGIGIDAPLNEVERELTEKCDVDEAKYRSERRILVAFAIERALIEIANGDNSQLAKGVHRQFAEFMTQLAERKSHAAIEGFILRIGSYEKALRSEDGLQIGLPAAFANWVDDMNTKARPFLIVLGLVAYKSASEAVHVIVASHTAMTPSPQSNGQT